jgi:hypothetical protein
MSTAASLGTFMVEFDADPSKLIAKLGEGPKSALATGKKIEKAIETSIDKAFKAASRTFDSTWAQLKAGGKIGEAAVVRNAKAIIQWRAEIEKTRGSIEKATDSERAQYAALEVQLKKLREEAAKPRATPIPATPQGQPLSAFEKSAMAANVAIADFQTKLTETGNVGAGDIKKLTTLEILHRREIEKKFGSLDKATPEAQSNYQKIERAVKAAKKDVIALTEEFRDQRQAQNKYGA